MRIEKLETDRLFIRHFNIDDFESVYNYMSDPNIIEHLPEDLFSEEQAIAEEECNASEASHRSLG